MLPDARTPAGRALYWGPAIATALLIFALSHQPSLPSVPGDPPDWMAHGLEYGFFTLTLIFALSEGFSRRRLTAITIAAAVVIAAAYGVSDEWHQSFVGRDATVQDWIADLTGALIVAVIVWLLARRMAASNAPV